MTALKGQLFSLNRNGWIRKIYGVVVFALCVSSIVVNAHYSAITLDEAHTYVDYVTEFRLGSTGEFLQDYDGRANNHLLNTVLIFAVDRISGIHYDEFLIRFPSVCFGVCFCVFCFSLYRKKKLSTFLFSFLMLNVYACSQFSLARGYGMATCLSMAAIWFIKKYAESDYAEHRFLSVAILFFTLAETANTVVLLLTASAALLLFIIMLRKQALFDYLKKQWLFLIPLAAANILLLFYHMYVSADGEGKALATYQGNAIDGIIGGFCRYYTGCFAGIGIWFLILLIIGAVLCGIIQKKKLFFVWLFAIYFGLCSASAAVMGKGLPNGAQLLPAYPMIAFAVNEAIVLLLDCVIKSPYEKWRKGLWTVFSIGCSGFFLMHFVRNVDVTYNNDLRTHLYDSVMGSYDEPLGSEELHELHMPFYSKQFLYRYGYDVYQKKYTIEAMSLGETLRMLSNRKFDAMIEINDKEALSKYAYEFRKLGIDIKNLPETTDYILLKRGAEEKIEYIYAFKDSNRTQDTIMGTMSLFYGENGSYGIYMNGNECLTVKPIELQPIASVCVWQNGEDEPMDYKLYME